MTLNQYLTEQITIFTNKVKKQDPQAFVKLSPPTTQQVVGIGMQADSVVAELAVKAIGKSFNYNVLCNQQTGKLSTIAVI